MGLNLFIDRAFFFSFFSFLQEFKHLGRALGEHLEQYWKDSQIECKSFFDCQQFFR